MARQMRKKSGTGIYHVMPRGINRQDIFEDDEDYLQMTSILRGQSERYDEKGLRLPPFCTFYAYCLMSNHLHLLIQEREDNVRELPILLWFKVLREQDVMKYYDMLFPMGLVSDSYQD